MESSCSLEPDSGYSWCKERRIKTRRSQTAADDLVCSGAGDPECLPLESLPYAVFARAGIMPVRADSISWRLIATSDTADYYTDES
jgi:hypothetical protein